MAMPAEDQFGSEVSQPLALMNDEAEQALLGAILANNAAYDRVSDLLGPEHFGDGVHARIFEASANLINRGQKADAIRLKAFFDKEEALRDVGGAEYLARLQAGYVTILNARDYALTIRDAWMRRQMAGIAEDMTERAFSPDLEIEPRQAAEEATDRLTRLLEANSQGEGPKALSGLLRGVTQKTEDIRNGNVEPALSTGLADLDRALAGGLRPGLIVIAARPSMGKTALAGNIARNVASRISVQRGPDGTSSEQSQPVIFFSMEMSDEELAQRLICERAGLKVSQAQNPRDMAPSDWAAYLEEARALESLPLHIDDQADITAAAIYSRALGMKRRHGLSLVIVDYLQLMRPAAGRRGENRVQEISEITRALKQISKRLEVPVIALSQLSRAVEQREDKRPYLSDLRESGSIEQDADVVAFLYRHAYYLERAEPQRREGEEEKRWLERLNHWSDEMRTQENRGDIIIAKARQGRVQTVQARFEGSVMRWGDLARQHDIEGMR